MDGPTFATLVQRLADRAARRGVLAGLAGAGLAGAAGLTRDNVAGKKKKTKKVTLCRGGQTITASAKQKKKLLKAGATLGACPTITSTSTSTTSTTPAVCPDLQPGADVQAAINAAAPGDTLRLCPGRFRVTSTLNVNKDLTLIGAGFQETILDGEDARRVVTVSSPTTGTAAITLENLTITGGNATGAGGGIGLQSNTTVTLRGVVVTKCMAVTGGGVTMLGSTLILENTAITDCIATDPEVGGGGIASTEGTVILKADSTVARNRAGKCGGGLLMLAANASKTNVLTLQAGSQVFENEADEGGGICVFFGTVTVEAGSSVGDNTARGSGVGDFGGGIRHFASDLTLADGTVGANDPDNCLPAKFNCI